MLTRNAGMIPLAQSTSQRLPWQAMERRLAGNVRRERQLRQAATLSHLEIEGPQASASSPTILFMHGILGSKKNWRQFARRVVGAHPTWRALLIDHRGHGDSPSMDAPHSLQACALDVAATLAHLGRSADVVCGHSFGGKVALSLLDHTHQAGLPVPRHTWVLDSMPWRWARGEDPRSGSDSVRGAMAALADMQPPFASQTQVIEEVRRRGFSLSLAQWMTTNLRGSPSTGYTWAFDIAVAQQLFTSFCDTDMLSMLAHAPAPISLVRAQRNSQWQPARLDELAATIRGTQVELHVLPDAGHWVHMDNPVGLAALMSPSLARISARSGE